MVRATDNSTFSAFRQDSLIASGTFGQVLSNEFEPTDLSVNMPAQAIDDGDNETDLIYQQRDGVPHGAAGITWCNDALSYQRCDQMYNAFYTTLPSYALICHETGHAVGLLPGENASPAVSNSNSYLACMTTPASYSNLGSHNQAQINEVY